MRNNFQSQLTASLAHEQLTPLNAIINGTETMQDKLLSDLVSKTFCDPKKKPKPGNWSKILKRFYENQVNTYEISRIIWSSAKIMSSMIMSQVSHTKIRMKMLFCNFEPISNPIHKLILEFLLPFQHYLEQKEIKVEVSELNEIPDWVCTDWSLYKQTLYHLVSNAIKFNCIQGSIKILISFHTFKDEFKMKTVNETSSKIKVGTSFNQDNKKNQLLQPKQKGQSKNKYRSAQSQPPLAQSGEQ